MVQARRRVSYIIPSPTETPPRLELPPHGVLRLGATGPLLTPCDELNAERPQDKPKHPRHRLGVASLVLDSSTHLVGRDAPEGILYSGGRDGLVMSWDLGMPMKKRRVFHIPRKRGRWESMTGWGDDSLDEETEDAEVGDGDILGEVKTMDKRRRAASSTGETPHERGWETDLLAFQRGKRTEFRQCAQVHSDWVNDILLCNYNQTVVSASSDGTVKAWNPHASIPTDPSTIGSHSDYVRCLSYCRDQNWIASGSFDRSIKLWDLSRSSVDPLVTLSPPDAAPKSSVYALAADPFGRTIASGSPERVIRLWDPRSGKRIGKLVGHTDNIRAILISEDSKYLLTGSADASIKLWSLASQKCLHTFVHHADSVWSLFSDHPSLEVFYSGDRSGLVCRVDVDNSPDLSEGECVVLCNDSSDSTRSSSEGINKIVVMDDNLLWTASGTSTIRRWDIPQRRAARASSAPLISANPDAERIPDFKRRVPIGTDVPSEASTRPSTAHDRSRRMSASPSVQSIASEQWPDRENEMKLNGLPYDSLVKMVSLNDPFASYTSSSGIRDPEVATLYSAASIKSVPRQNTRATPNPFQPNALGSPSYGRTEENIMMVNTARALFEERELATDAIPLCTEPDDVIPGDHGLVRSMIMNDRITALTVDTAGQVAVWDIVRGKCLGQYPPEDVAAAASQSGSIASGSGDRERSPREALEAVRELIEGEGVAATWCNADTKGGVLTIHLTERCFDAEVYADEVGFADNHHFSDESKLNVGKWVLRNLFIGFIQEEIRLRQGQSQNGKLSRTSSQDTLDKNLRNRFATPSLDLARPNHFAHSTVLHSPKMVPAISPKVSSVVPASPLLAPLIPIHVLLRDTPSTLPPIPQSPAIISDTTPTPGVHQSKRSGTIDGSAPPLGVTIPNTLKEDYFSPRGRQQTTSGGVPATPDDFSGWTGPPKTEPPTPSTPSGLMSRLKMFGKKRPVSDAQNVSTPATPAETPSQPDIHVQLNPLQKLLSTPLSPPSSIDGPLYPLSPNTTVLVAEEGQPSYTTIYRRSVANIHEDVETLEAAMPLWLVEYLLLNRTPPFAPLAKLSFVLFPWNKDPDAELLPELLNVSQSKLTANRYLRVRKILYHVQDKLDKITSGSRAGSIRSSVDPDDSSRAHRPRAEDEYEILCQDTLLPLGMSLAAVRQYVWKQGTELVMHYRRKGPSRLNTSG